MVEFNAPATRTLKGSAAFFATAGQTVNIETSPRGEEILSEDVPRGKVWEIKVSVAIEETDA